MSDKAFVRMTVQSPFTTVYPRYNRWHAVQALKQLEDFIILDCETSGVGKDAEVTEIAIVDYKSCDVLFNSLIHPYNLSDYESSKARSISGISKSELLKAPPLPQLWTEILNVLQSKHITAFNADFDMRMIRNSAQKWDIEAPPFNATCLMKLTTAFLNLDFWVSLEQAASYFSVDNIVAHRALADALVAREIVMKMKDESRFNNAVKTQKLEADTRRYHEQA